MKSEWIKLASLRSSWITLAFAVLGVVGISVIATAVTASRWDSLSAESQAGFDPVGITLTGVVLAQLIMAVLGVLVVTGEYATRMIRTSLAAVPRRLMLLTGKITVSAVVSLMVSLVASFAAFLIGQQLLGTHGTTLDAPDVLRSVVGAAFYLSAVVVIGSAIGFVVRSTAGGIAATLGLLLVLPVMSFSLPYEWVRDMLQYLPSEAGLAIYQASGVGSTLSLTEAIVTLGAWVVVSIVAAAVVLVRRDA